MEDDNTKYNKYKNTLFDLTDHTSKYFLILLLDQIRDFTVFPFLRTLNLETSEAYSSFSTVFDILVFHVALSFTKNYSSKITELYVKRSYSQIIRLTNQTYMLFFIVGVVSSSLFVAMLPTIYSKMLNPKAFAVIIGFFNSIAFGIPFMFIKIVNIKLLEAVNRINVCVYSSLIGLATQIICLFIFIVKLELVGVGVTLSINLGIAVSLTIQMIYTYKMIENERWLDFDSNKSNYDQFNKSENESTQNTETRPFRKLSNHSNNSDEEKWLNIEIRIANQQRKARLDSLSFPDKIKTFTIRFLDDLKPGVWGVLKDYSIGGLLTYISILSFELSTFLCIWIGDREYTVFNYQTVMLKFLFLFPGALSTATSILSDKLNDPKVKISKRYLDKEQLLILQLIIVFVYSLLMMIAGEYCYLKSFGLFTSNEILYDIADQNKNFFTVSFALLALHSALCSYFEEKNSEKIVFYTVTTAKIVLAYFIAVQLIVGNKALSSIYSALGIGEVLFILSNIVIIILKQYWAFMSLMTSEKTYLELQKEEKEKRGLVEMIEQNELSAYVNESSSVLSIEL